MYLRWFLMIILVFSHLICSVLPIQAATEITLTAKADSDSDNIQKQVAAQRAEYGVRKQVDDQEQRIGTQQRTMMQRMRSPGENQRGGSKQSAKSTDDLEVYFLGDLASEGHADGQAYLGLMYVTGKDRSYSDAVTWFRKAAAQGNGYG